jgi:ribosomal protein L11 methyltransferase
LSNQPDPKLWQLSTILPFNDASGLEPIFEDFALTTSLIEHVEDGSLWRLEVLFQEEPDKWLLDQIPASIAYDLGPLVHCDWVSESQKLQPPVQAGRVYVHGSHDAPHKINSMHDLVVEAGRAFGTGLHETTFGCLKAIHDVHKRRNIRNALDLGCGSGVLALAIAKTWGYSVIASDIDIDAVDVTRENAQINGLSHKIRAVEATGLNDRFMKRNAPYDLIVANILAWPLVKLAPDISKALAPTGTLILAGLLKKQENMVRNSYRLHGLSLRQRYCIGSWHTLVLEYNNI